MFQKIHFVWLFTVLVCLSPLMAQSSSSGTGSESETEETETEDSTGPARFWQAKLADGSFMVALDKITSVSRHKYVLDGSLLIDEVTVDTVGQALTRFYFISPITDATAANSVTGLADRGRELVDKAAERVGTKVHNMVVKKYPDTSHAKSIEFRILSEKELTALFTSVQTAWEAGRGRLFKLK